MNYFKWFSRTDAGKDCLCLLAQHQSQVMLFTNPSPCFLLSGGIQPQPVLSDCGRWRHRCLWQGHAAHLLLKLPPVPNPWNQAPAYLNHSKVSRRRRRSQKHLLFSQPGLCLVTSSVGRRQQQPCVVYKAGPFCLIDIQKASLLLLKMWGWFIEVKWRSRVLPDAHNKENKHNVFCCLRMTDWRAVSIFPSPFFSILFDVCSTGKSVRTAVVLLIYTRVWNEYIKALVVVLSLVWDLFQLVKSFSICSYLHMHKCASAPSFMMWTE